MVTARQLRSPLVRSPAQLRAQVRWADTDNANTTAWQAFFWGQESIVSTLAFTEESDTSSFAGNVLSAISGALSFAEGDDTALFLLSDGVAVGSGARPRVLQYPMRARVARAPRTRNGLY